MTIKRKLLGAFTLLLTQPAFAQTGEIELKPGHWRIDDSVASEGTGQSFADTKKICISPERAVITFEEIAADMVEGDQCSFDFTDVSANAARGNAACDIPDDQTQIRGTLSGNWTSTTYSVTATVQITGPGGSDTVRYNKVATYVGPCS